jgi:hypothetical protein
LAYPQAPPVVAQEKPLSMEQNQMNKETNQYHFIHFKSSPKSKDPKRKNGKTKSHKPNYKNIHH